jgi:hypothetical protein
MAIQTTYSQPISTSAVSTNGDTYFPANSGWFNTRGAYSVVLSTRRTSDVGTCTFQAFAEYLYEPDNTFLALLDYAGTAVQGVSYADGIVDTATAAHRLILSGELPPGATVGVLTFNTVDKAYQIWLPEKIRFRFRHGGTAVQNVFSAQVDIHTRM